MTGVSNQFALNMGYNNPLFSSTGTGTNATNVVAPTYGIAQPQSTSFGLTTDEQNFWFGGQGQAGVVPTGINAGNALAQSWLGFQQLGLAQDSFNFQKDAFERNFAMQEDAYNTAKANQEATAAAQNA